MLLSLSIRIWSFKAGIRELRGYMDGKQKKLSANMVADH